MKTKPLAGYGSMDELSRLAKLIKARNAVASDIAAIIGRPAQLGHLGEYIAARIFGIELEASAVHKGSDGHFTDGPLAGKTVNIKLYAKLEGLLDINPDGIPDYYLVLTGPRSAAASSRSGVRPWVIEAAFLFDANELIEALRRRGVKLGIATSVAHQYWEEAEVYSSARNQQLTLSTEQRRLLALFK